MKEPFNFFITTMPDTRPAAYYISCLDGSVFMDFDNYGDGRICLKRISFDGYGCCSVTEEAIPMNEADSDAFKKLIETQLSDQAKFERIVKTTIANNKKFLWEDALTEYGLL